MLSQEEIDSFQIRCRIGTELDKKLSILEKGFADYKELANGKLDLIRVKIENVDEKTTQCNSIVTKLTEELICRDKKLHAIIMRIILGSAGALGTAFISIIILILTKVLSH